MLPDPMSVLLWRSEGRVHKTLDHIARTTLLRTRAHLLSLELRHA